MLCLSLFLISFVLAQNFGTQKTEYHLPFAYSECTSSGCQAKQGGVTLDANWRWVHVTTGY